MALTVSFVSLDTSLNLSNLSNIFCSFLVSVFDFPKTLMEIVAKEMITASKLNSSPHPNAPILIAITPPFFFYIFNRD